MDDETYIKSDFKQLPGPKFYTWIVRGRVSNKFKYKSLDKFGKNFLLSQTICSCGLRSRAFVTEFFALSYIFFDFLIVPNLTTACFTCLFSSRTCHISLYAICTQKIESMNAID